MPPDRRQRLDVLGFVWEGAMSGVEGLGCTQQKDRHGAVAFV
jgi:hypothetical protein